MEFLFSLLKFYVVGLLFRHSEVNNEFQFDSVEGNK
jgi:hypothetical protein